MTMSESAAEQAAGPLSTGGTARSEETRPKRHPAFLVLIALIVATNAFTAFVLARRAFGPVDPYRDSSLPVDAIFAVLAGSAIVFAVMLIRWRRLGFFGLAAVAFVTAVINAIFLGLGSALIGLVQIPLLYWAMQLGDRTKMVWPRLDQPEVRSAADRRWIVGTAAVVASGLAVLFLSSFVGRGSGGPIALVRGEFSSGELVLMKSDGSGARQVTSNSAARLEPKAWSPDGKHLLFEGSLSANRRTVSNDLFRVDSSGGGVKRLVREGNLPNFSVAWSPSSSEFAYGQEGEVIVMSRDGSDRRTIVDDRPEVDYRVMDWGEGGILIDEDNTLVVVDPDGSNRRELLTAGILSRGAWSPDGSQIAVAARLVGDEGFQLWLLDTDGENGRQLTFTSEVTNFVAWSPDGEELLAQADGPDNKGVILLVAADGSRESVIGSDTGEFLNPIGYSSDGRDILHNRNRNDDIDIFLIDTNGANLRQLTDGDIDETAEAWATG